MPGVADVTFAITVQGPPAGIVLPVDNVIELPPATAVTTPPPQVVLAFGLGARTTPAGNESTSAAVIVAAVAFALATVIVSVEIPPGPLVLGLKALVTWGTTGVVALTVKTAVAATGLLPQVVWSPLTGIVLV